MEYVGFTIFIAASGAIIFLFIQYICNPQKDYRRRLRQRQLTE